MKINLKMNEEIENSVKELSKTTGIDLNELVTDLFIIGLQLFIFSTKIVRETSKKGGVKYDNDSSKIA